MRQFAKVATAAGVVALALVGCSSTKVIDGAKVESEAVNILERVGVTTTSVSCPDDVEIRSGESFDCTATAEDGTEFTMVVTMTDDDGAVDIESGGDVVLMTDEVMQQAADFVAGEVGEDVDLACPPVQELPNGSGTVTCDVESETLVGTVDLVFDESRLVGVE